MRYINFKDIIELSVKNSALKNNFRGISKIMQNFFENLGAPKGLIESLLIYAVIIGGMYFLLFRPQQKKRKQEEEMRKALAIGDEITTIGGIVGRIISIKNDSDLLVIESGTEKIKIKSWAVAAVETKKE